MLDRIKHSLIRTALPRRKRLVIESKIEPHRFEFKMGDRVHFLEANRELPEFETFDFAATAIASLAMRRGLPVRFDLPVSEGAAIMLARISLLWSVRFPRASHPLDLELPNIVPDPVQKKSGGILCLSAGVDSTHAAIEATRDHGYTHGMALHGIDFSLDNPNGFEKRFERTSRIADIFGLDPIIVRSNIVKTYRDREAYYTLLLVSALQFSGASLARGGFAADQTVTESIISTTASNVPGIDGYVSTPSLPIDHLSIYPDRFEKIQDIYDYNPELLSNLGFCFFDQENGGNCGECEKCMRARFALDLIDMPQTLLFRDSKDPIDYYARESDGKRITQLLTVYRLEDLALRSPIGQKRNRALHAAATLRKKLTGHQAPMVAESILRQENQ